MNSQSSQVSPGARVTLTGYIDVPAERFANVEEALPVHIELTRAEPGCLAFEVIPCPDLKGRFLVSESFVDQQAFEAHQARTSESVWADVTQGIPREYTITVEE